MSKTFMSQYQVESFEETWRFKFRYFYEPEVSSKNKKLLLDIEISECKPYGITRNQNDLTTIKNERPKYSNLA